MTTSPHLDRLALRSPDALLSALPYLLGFHPIDSAVIVWLGTGRLLLTQRLDLPTLATDLDQWNAAVWCHPAAEAATEVVLVIVADAVPPGVDSLLRAEAAVRGIGVRDIMRVDGGRWWSLLCDDPGCCPPEGRVIPQDVADAVGAEFALLGCSPMPDRDSLVRSLEPDDDAVAAVSRLMPPSHRLRGASRERWRDARLADLDVLLVTGPGAESGLVGRVIVGLRDIRVRDTFLWDVCTWHAEHLPVGIAAMAAVLRAAPPGHVAPVATALAVLAWLGGDGARARIAIDRALADERDYSLALLLDASIRGGLPPSSWREAMSQLARDDCRHGSARGPSAQ